MKYSEAVRLVEENPNRVIEAHCNVVDKWIVRMSVVRGISRYFHFEVLDGGKVIDQSLPAGAFNGNVALDLDWQLVRQSVTWQEAIEAWGEGHTIKKCFPNSEQTYPSGTTIHLTKNDVVNGTWYVED